MSSRAWPTAADVASRLRIPLTSLSPTEQTELEVALASAIGQARVIPEWRVADLIPDQVWSAVVGLAALDFRIANAAAGVDTGVGDAGNAGSARWRYLTQIGYGRGGRARVG